MGVAVAVAADGVAAGEWVVARKRARARVDRVSRGAFIGLVRCARLGISRT